MTSLNFIAGNSSYFTRTNFFASHSATFSISFFLKWPAVGGPQYLAYFGQGTSNQLLYLSLTATGQIQAQSKAGGLNLISNETVPADGKWHHILLAVDATLVTATDRTHLYLDGVEVTYNTQTIPNQNANIISSHGDGWAICSGSDKNYVNGYIGLLDEFRYIDGYQILPPAVRSSGGGPVIYTGSYGPSGFYLDFSDATSAATLGYDRSGNAINWTPVNILPSYASTDVPAIALVPSGLTLGSPIFGSPTINVGTILPVNLAVGSPVFGTPVLSTIGINNFVALNGAVLGPQLASPFMLCFKPASLGSAWTADTGASIGAGQISPDGFDGGVLLIDTATTGHFGISQEVDKLNVASAYRLSFDVAATGSGQAFELRLSDGKSGGGWAYATFDPETGECLVRDCTADFRILSMESDPLRFGFRRYVLMAESNTERSILGSFSLATALTSPPSTTYAGSGSGSVVIWNPLLLQQFDLRDFRWEIGPPEMRFYWTVHFSEVGLIWFRCGHGELGVDPHLRFIAAPDLDCVLRRWEPAQTDLVFDFSGALLAGSGDPMAGTP